MRTVHAKRVSVHVRTRRTRGQRRERAAPQGVVLVRGRVGGRGRRAGVRRGGRGVAGDRRRAVGHRDRGQEDGRDSTNTKQQTMTQTGSTRFDATLRGDLPSTRADTARRVRTRWLEISRARAGLVSASLKTPTNMKVPTNRYGKKARLPRKRVARGGVSRGPTSEAVCRAKNNNAHFTTRAAVCGAGERGER